jgi:AraC-like DNA-binding protein
LAGLAAEAGYADQAHLSRECRAIAGATPTEVVAALTATPVDAIPDLHGRGDDARPIGSRPRVRHRASSVG